MKVYQGVKMSDWQYWMSIMMDNLYVDHERATIAYDHLVKMKRSVNNAHH